MSSVSGWYPDPAGTPQLRFWDGQSWTTALAPMQVAPQPVAYPPTYANPQHLVATPYVPRGPAGRSKRFYGWIAAGVAAAVAAVVVIPMALGGKPAPTDASFSRVLLTVNEVSTTGSASFSITPKDDSKDNSNTNLDCLAGNLGDKYKSAEKASASRQFQAQAQGEFAEEDLSYNPGTAAAQLADLKQQLTHCKTVTIAGEAFPVTVLPSPTVPGSDDTFGIEMGRTIAGRSFVIDEKMARFGDTLVLIAYGGLDDPAVIQSVTGGLLNQAVTKAKGVL